MPCTQHAVQHNTQHTYGCLLLPPNRLLLVRTDSRLTRPCAACAWLQFMMNVLLLNVLIASMTNSFSKITQVRRLTLPVRPCRSAECLPPCSRGSLQSCVP